MASKKKSTPVRGKKGMTGAGPRRDKRLMEAEMRALGIKPKKKRKK